MPMIEVDDEGAVVHWPNGANAEGYSDARVGDGLKVYPSPTLKGSGGTVQKGCTNTLNTYEGCGSATIGEGFRIRYLTPRECFRLMGQSDDAIDRIMAVETSKTALYRMAGNSIVVDVLADIFRGMYVEESWTRGSRQGYLDIGFEKV